MKRKGFTLIELLAVIVILAIIALIAIPQVIKILNKSKLSAAEDSTYGLVKSAENYYGNFLMKNKGNFPIEDLEFSCDNTGCSLVTELEGYNLEGLEKIEYNGKKASSGKLKIKNNGQEIEVKNAIFNGYKCNYTIEEKAKCGKDETEEVLSLRITLQSQTSNSLRVVINKSGNIKNYEYCISKSTNEDYCLDDNNYSNVEVINNAFVIENLDKETNYVVYVKATDGKKEVKDKKTGKTLGISAATYKVENEDKWSQSKEVTIKYPSGNYTYSYKILTLDGTGEYLTETSTTEKETKITVDKNCQVIGIVRDDTNQEQASNQPVDKIDNTEPVESTFTITNKTGTSVTVEASGRDEETRITRYLFSKDNGVTWESSETENKPQTSNSYTFSNLTSGTHTIKTMVINETYEVEKEVNNKNSLVSTNSDAVTIYTVSFETQDTEITNPSSKQVVNGETYGELPTISKNEYNFEGWYTDTTYTTKIESTTTVSLTGNQTLYAKLTQKTYEVEFDSQTSEVTNPTSIYVTNGSKYGTLPEPTRTEYEFSGWYTSTGYTTKIDSTTDVVGLTGKQTLYAKWEKKKYEIAFDTQDATVTNPESKYLSNGDKYGTLPKVEKEGYVLEGWYTSTGYTTKIESTTDVVGLTGKQILYAKWKEKGILKTIYETPLEYYLDPTDLSITCTSAASSETGTNSSCMRFFAYGEDWEDNIVAILDHNTTAKVSNWSSAQSQVKTDTSSWVAVIYGENDSRNPRNISSTEIQEITNEEPRPNVGAVPPSYVIWLAGYSWLFDRTYNCERNGCTTEDDSTYGYWTSNTYDSSSAWAVQSMGGMTSSSRTLTGRGVRPVITIPKS